MSPLHDLRIVGGENESSACDAIEMLHHVEQRDGGGRVPDWLSARRPG